MTWVEASDPKSGRTYYYNKATKKTSWKRPPEMDEPAAPAVKPLDPNEDPANWKTGTDPKTGRTYYFNKKSKKTSWKKPACLNEDESGGAGAAKPAASAAAAAAPAAAKPVQAAANPVAKPKSPWVEAQDPKSGRTYWYNKTTKKTTWKNPNPPDEDGGGGAAAAAPQPARQERPAVASGRRHFQDTDDDEDEDVNEAAPVSSSDDEGAGAGGGGDDSGDDQGSQMLKVKQAMAAQDIETTRRTLQDDDSEEEEHEYQMAKHRKGWLRRKLRLGGFHDNATLLSFKKSLIKKALLKQNRDLDAEAIQCFKNIMSYMGDRKSSKEPIEHSKKLLRNLMVAPAGLRDEAYMQLCKQTTKNPRVEATIKGWELFTYFLATFPPSKTLKSFVADYIRKTLQDSSKPRVQRLAENCGERLEVICKIGQRKQVPSRLELECLKEGKLIPIRVPLVNGTFKTFNVSSYTLVGEVEEQMQQKLNLITTDPFGLYEQAEANVERLLDPKDRILDVMASWENSPLVDEVKDDRPTKSRYYKQTKAERAAAAAAAQEAQAKAYNQFLFKAKLVLKTSVPEIMADPEAINLIFVQAVQDVVTERYPVKEKDITVLAALQLQAQFGDFRRDQHHAGWLRPKIHEFMPQALLMKSKDKTKQSDKKAREWEQKILAKYAKVSGFTALEAKLNYLDYVQEWTFYGATFFTVEQRQFKDYPSPLTLGITCEGSILMHPEKRTVLENYPYPDIVTWGHSDEKFIVVVGNIVQQRKLIFKTDQGKIMNQLIHAYVKSKVRAKQ